jgi:hypothetical protein
MTQIEYMEILFNELGFNRAQRNDYLTNRFRRQIRHLDALSKSEASFVIDDLKSRKVVPPPRDDRDPEDE